MCTLHWLLYPSFFRIVLTGHLYRPIRHYSHIILVLSRQVITFPSFTFHVPSYPSRPWLLYSASSLISAVSASGTFLTRFVLTVPCQRSSGHAHNRNNTCACAWHGAVAVSYCRATRLAFATALTSLHLLLFILYDRVSINHLRFLPKFRALSQIQRFSDSIAKAKSQSPFTSTAPAFISDNASFFSVSRLQLCSCEWYLYVSIWPLFLFTLLLCFASLHSSFSSVIRDSESRGDAPPLLPPSPHFYATFSSSSLVIWPCLRVLDPNLYR